MTKKRKLPANFGPKDLSKLPAGLRAYWEKKRAGEKGKSAGDKDVTRKADPKADKPAKKTQKKTTTAKKPTAKIGVRKTTRRRLTDAKKKTNKPKREGGNDIRVVRKLVKTRSSK